MEGIIKIKEENPNTHLLILAYDNTIEKIGEDKFIGFCIEIILLSRMDMKRLKINIPIAAFSSDMLYYSIYTKVFGMFSIMKRDNSKN